MSEPTGPMDGDAYEAHHSFVWRFGIEVADLLDPQPGERILDLGCGGGQLTARIASVGASVTGVDLDADLVARAAVRHPTIRWIHADLVTLDLGETFDAVFSNATLHWVDGPLAAGQSIARHLRPGGRFVAEFGGASNCAGIIEAMLTVHPDAQLSHPWYFPSEDEFAAVLETVGLRPDVISLFRRPTVLEGGLAGWIQAFGAWALDGIEDVPAYLDAVERIARRRLWKDDHWEADYVRLRVTARMNA